MALGYTGRTEFCACSVVCADQHSQSDPLVLSTRLSERFLLSIPDVPAGEFALLLSSDSGVVGAHEEPLLGVVESAEWGDGVPKWVCIHDHLGRPISALLIRMRYRTSSELLRGGSLSHVPSANTEGDADGNAETKVRVAPAALFRKFISPPPVEQPQPPAAVIAEGHVTLAQQLYPNSNVPRGRTMATYALLGEHSLRFFKHRNDAFADNARPVLEWALVDMNVGVRVAGNAPWSGRLEVPAAISIRLRRTSQPWLIIGSDERETVTWHKALLEHCRP